MGFKTLSRAYSAMFYPTRTRRCDVDLRGTLILFKPLLLVSILAISSPVFAAAEAGAQTERPIAGIEWRNVEKMLSKHFSFEDIASLKAYLKAAMLGQQLPMAPDLKEKVRNFMMEMRLEYGFQFAVIMEQMKKKVFRALPPELAKLAEEFSKNHPADLLEE